MTLLFGTSNSTNIQCTYSEYSFQVVGTIYYCWIKVHLQIQTRKAAHIGDAKGTHQNSKDNSDINGINVDNGAIHYFPNGFDKIFFNIKLIYILNSELKEVHQSDLSPFSKLKELDLRGNQIEIIGEDLFEFNNELEYISFANNKIYHIHPDVFDNLIHLKYLKLRNNKCISRDVKDDLDEIRELISTLNLQCLSFEYRFLVEKIKVLEIATLVLNSGAFNAKIAELENKVRKSKFSHFNSFQNVLQNAKNVQTPREENVTKTPELNVTTEVIEI